MRNFAGIAGLAMFVGSAVAPAASWQCWLTVMPDNPSRSLVWNGAVPASWDFVYKGLPGKVTIDAIGMPGHPDYGFAFHWQNKTLLSSSQPKGLTDYNLVWNPDDASQNVISFACYEASAP